MNSKLNRIRKKLFHSRHRHAPGTAPGTMVAHPGFPDTAIHLLGITAENRKEQANATLDQVKDFLTEWPVVWISVVGLGNVDLISKLGEIFTLHPLTLEDIVNVHQRPKIEEYDNYLFITTRLAQLKNGDLDLEQIGLILGRGFILSFEERATGCLDPVRDRIRKPLSNRVRLSSPDYLVYAMLDTIVDAIFPVLEKYSDQLDRLEEDVLSNPAPSLVNQIHRLKHDLILLIRLFWQQRESLNQLVKENEKFSNDTRVFLRDCHDHIFQIIDILETFRERASGLTDIYLSSLSNRMNEIIKVLTMIATIFMPLGFVAGLYGMNFDRGASPLNMPELGWYFGYPFALGLMVAIALGLILFFRRKGWLGDSLARNSRQDSVSAEA